MTARRQGIIGVALAQTILGTLGLCVLAAGASPLSVAFYRCAIAALAIGAYAVVRGDLGTIVRLPRRVLLLAMLSGFLMVGNWVLFFEAINRSGISIATIVFHVQPLLMVLLGAVMFRERLHLLTFVWFAVALVGLVLATGVLDKAAGIRTDYLGIAAALGAAGLYALVTLIAQRLPRTSGLQLTLVQCLCGAFLLLPWLPLLPWEVTGEQWKWLAIIGLIHTAGVYILLYGALPKLPTATAAVLLFLYPISAIVVDAVWFRHPITLLQLAGFIGVVAASLGITLKWGMRGRRSAAKEAKPV